MNAIIYTNLTDHINQSTYSIEAPAYSNFEAKEFGTGELDRFFVPDKNHLVQTRACIADMVDMVDKVIPFKILRSDDIIEVFDFLNRYAIELSQYLEINESARSYHPKCLALIDKLNHSINILANQGIRKAIKIRTRFGIDSYFHANPR